MSKIIVGARISSAAVILIAGCMAASASEPYGADEELESIIVLGKRIIRESASATGLDLSLRETPQSVTVVSAAQAKEFDLTDANQLLASVTGINVEAVETDRTYYKESS